VSLEVDPSRAATGEGGRDAEGAVARGTRDRVRASAGRTFASLRVPAYRRFVTGQVVSFSGNWMQIVAQAGLVERLTGSGTQLGLVAAVQFGPVLVFGPFGGVLADRFDNRRLAMVTQTLFALLTATMGVLTITGDIRMWMIFVIAAGIGFVNAVDNPVRQTIVFEMVGPDTLANAVGLNSVIMNVARLTGPGLAALTIVTVGLGWSFIANAATFLVMLVVLLSIKPSQLRRDRGPARASRKGWLREGFSYVWREPKLRYPLLMMTVIGMLTYEFQVFLPLLSSKTFGRDESGYAALTAAMGLGAIFGGLWAAARMQPTHGRLVRSAVVFGVLVLGLAAAPTLPIALLVLPFVGASSITYVALANATLQVNAAPEMRGRVMALYSTAFMGTTPIGAPIIGIIGEHIGPRVAVAVAGTAAVVAGAAAAVVLRDVVRGDLAPAAFARARRR
jgi:MFS family permease